MGRDSWYRNSTWNDAIEATFFENLRRAKDKQQYLRIQAWYLVDSHPNIALILLDEYGRLGDHFDSATACALRGLASKALGRYDDAFRAFDAALQWERRRPTVLTDAYLLFPLLALEISANERYQQALKILEENQHRPAFPIDKYRWFGARAVLLEAVGRPAEAIASSKRALEAAKETHSGFRNHPRLGLVVDLTDEFGRKLELMANTRH